MSFPTAAPTPQSRYSQFWHTLPPDRSSAPEGFPDVLIDSIGSGVPNPAAPSTLPSQTTASQTLPDGPSSSRPTVSTDSSPFGFTLTPPTPTSECVSPRFGSETPSSIRACLPSSLIEELQLDPDYDPIDYDAAFPGRAPPTGFGPIHPDAVSEIETQTESHKEFPVLNSPKQSSHEQDLYKRQQYRNQAPYHDNIYHEAFTEYAPTYTRFSDAFPASQWPGPVIHDPSLIVQSLFIPSDNPLVYDHPSPADSHDQYSTAQLFLPLNGIHPTFQPAPFPAPAPTIRQLVHDSLPLPPSVQDIHGTAQPLLPPIGSHRVRNGPDRFRPTPTPGNRRLPPVVRRDIMAFIRNRTARRIAIAAARNMAWDYVLGGYFYCC